MTLGGEGLASSAEIQWEGREDDCRLVYSWKCVEESCVGAMLPNEESMWVQDGMCVLMAALKA